MEQRGFSKEKSGSYYLTKGMDTEEAKTKDSYSTNCTEKISEEELYRLKIKIYIKYLPFRRILEKRKFLYLKNNEILTAEKHMII